MLVQIGMVVAEDLSVAPALVVDTTLTVVLVVVVGACTAVLDLLGAVKVCPPTVNVVV